MKFFLWFFGIILILFIAFVGIYHFNSNKGGWGKSFSKSLQAQSIDRNQQQTTTTNENSDPNVVPKKHTDAINAASTAAGVQTTLVGRNRNTYQLVIAWQGDQVDKAGVFLDDLTNQGLLADFEEIQPFTSGVNGQGQRVSQAAFEIRLR